MREISTRAVVALLVIAIAFATANVIFTIQNSHEPGLPSGAAITAEGYVNISVAPAVAISIIRDGINFTTTSVRGSRTSYVGTDLEGGCTSNDICGLNLTNDGTDLINITITDTQTMFTGATFNRARHYLYNVTMEADNYMDDGYRCSVGYENGLAGENGVGDWRAMPSAGSEVAICALNHTDASDSALVHINLTVPADEASGPKEAIITFTGVLFDAT